MVNQLVYDSLWWWSDGYPTRNQQPDPPNRQKKEPDLPSSAWQGQFPKGNFSEVKLVPLETDHRLDAAPCSSGLRGVIHDIERPWLSYPCHSCLLPRCNSQRHIGRVNLSLLSCEFILSCQSVVLLLVGWLQPVAWRELPKPDHDIGTCINHWPMWPCRPHPPLILEFINYPFLRHASVARMAMNEIKVAACWWLNAGWNKQLLEHWPLWTTTSCQLTQYHY